MDESLPKIGESKNERGSAIHPDLLASFGTKKSVLAGVVTALEVRKDHKQTIVTVDVGEEEKLVLLVQNSAGAFLGRIVLVDGKAKRIFHNSSQRFGFAIQNCLSIPPALTKNGVKLPKLLSSAVEKEVRSRFRPQAEIQRDRLIRSFRSSDNDKLTPSLLVRVIPHLQGRERADAELLAATQIMMHAEKTGDCALAAKLVEVVHHSKRDRLCSWFEEFSPISIFRKKKPYKARMRKDEDGTLKPFQLDMARRNTF